MQKESVLQVEERILFRIFYKFYKQNKQKNKRVMGIEPTYPAWKAGVLPLNYTRVLRREL